MLPGLGGGLDPKKMQAMMKQLGMDQEEVEAKRVIIERPDNSKIIIDNPSVTKITIKGQSSFQISGEVREQTGISEEDVKTVMEKTGASMKEAKKALESTNGDLAEAILNLSE